MVKEGAMPHWQVPNALARRVVVRVRYRVAW